MKAMIFAAGLGTRLAPLTNTMPKAMVPISGKPMIQHQIEKLRSFGVDYIVVNVHHFAEQIIDFVKNNDFGVQIEISDERDSKLIPAQLAPSAANTQTWYFTHNDDGSYNVYRNRRKLRLNKKMDAWNQIDIGIALAHIYITNEETFKFSLDGHHKELKNKVFEGTFTI